MDPVLAEIALDGPIVFFGCSDALRADRACVYLSWTRVALYVSGEKKEEEFEPPELKFL